MRTVTTALLASGAMLAAASAQAATVEITSVTAQWKNAQNAATPVLYQDQADNETRIDNWEDATVVSWGIPILENNGSMSFGDPDQDAQSDYTFDEYASGLKTGPFLLGRFTHNNRPVFYEVIESVELDLTVNGEFGDEDFAFNTIIQFEHDETVNSANCPHGDEADNVNGCSDLVSILPFMPQSIDLTGGTLHFNLSGFAASIDADPIFSFITVEDSENVSFLVADFEFDPVTPSPVPLPAAGWMLIAGIGGLVAMKRRQKARA